MRTNIVKAAVCLTAAATFLPTAPAHAAETALVAPGAPMRVFPSDMPQTLTNKRGQTLKVPPAVFAATCSQGPAGTVRLPDGTNRRVMLTAAHCVESQPGKRPVSPEVKVPQGKDYVRVGVRDRSSNPPAAALDLSDPMLSVQTSDWGVVLIDDAVCSTNQSTSRSQAGRQQGAPVQLTSIKDYRTLHPGEVAVDNFGQPICKDGATTGRSCGTQLGRTRNGVYSWGLNYDHGDSGGVNFDPRDGSVIGVSSLVLGPLGKTQPADRAIEDAYGVPDGQVNRTFQLSQPEAPRAEFPTTNEESNNVDQYILENNPDFKPAAPKDPKQELNKAVGAAQQDAQLVADQALRGQVNPAEVSQKIDQHLGQINYWGGKALANELTQVLR